MREARWKVKWALNYVAPRFEARNELALRSVRNCGKLLRSRLGHRKRLSGDFVIPFLGFLGIALHADAVAIHFRQSTLGKRMALFGGLAAPFESFLVIARHAATFAQE